MQSLDVRSTGDRHCGNKPQYISVLTSRSTDVTTAGMPNVILQNAGPCFCDIEQSLRERSEKMNANINYIGILNMLRYLVEKGAITKAESKKIAGHIAIKTGANIVILSELKA